MKAWRLAKARHKSLDGIGGEVAEGRWHRRGQRIVYAAASPSLAVLEVLVHLDLPPELLPDDYVLVGINIPDNIEIKRIGTRELPAGWNSPDGAAARAVGERWLDGRESAIMLVPSVIVPEESNVLINPRHSDAARIVEGSSRRFDFDLRLLR
jgi:RES domain-containing protein